MWRLMWCGSWGGTKISNLNDIAEQLDEAHDRIAKLKDKRYHDLSAKAAECTKMHHDIAQMLQRNEPLLARTTGYELIEQEKLFKIYEDNYRKICTFNGNLERMRTAVAMSECMGDLAAHLGKINGLTKMDDIVNMLQRAAEQFTELDMNTSELKAEGDTVGNDTDAHVEDHEVDDLLERVAHGTYQLPGTELPAPQKAPQPVMVPMDQAQAHAANQQEDNGTGVGAMPLMAQVPTEDPRVSTASVPALQAMPERVFADTSVAEDDEDGGSDDDHHHHNDTETPLMEAHYQSHAVPVETERELMHTALSDYEHASSQGHRGPQSDYEDEGNETDTAQALLPA